MALPPGITPKTVTVGIASFTDGSLASGTATITAPVNLVHTPTNRPIFSSQMSQRFVDGVATFNLCPTDAAGLNRVDWTYKLNVVISGAIQQPEPIYFPLPVAGPDVIDLDGLVTVPSSAGIPVSATVVTSVNGQTGAVTVTGGVGGAATVAWVESEAEADALPAGTLALILAPVATPAPADTTAPTVPTGLTATAGNALVTLSWTASTDAVGVTGYRVYRGGTLIASPTGTSYTDTGLTNATAYSYTVAAADAAGNLSAQTAAVTATPTTAATAPGQVTGLTATPGSGQVALSWTAPADGGSAITDYLIEYRTGAAAFAAFADGVAVGTSAIVAGLTDGTVYDFRVAAVNAVGTGAPSATVTATPTNVFTPASVAGLQVWLDARDLSGTAVASWPDKSGNARHAVQTDAAKQPMFTADALGTGRPAVRFAADAMTIPAVPMGAFTIFAVFKASGTAGLIYEHGANVASADGTWLYGTIGETLFTTRGGATLKSTRNATSNWSTTPAVTKVTCHRMDGTHVGHTLRLGGTLISTGTQPLTGDPGTATVTATLNLMARNNGASLPTTGDLACLLVYHGALSDANRDAVEAYLNTQWVA